MPRRKAPTTAPAAVTKTPPSKAHKRQVSSSAVSAATATPGSRQSKRIKASTENSPIVNSKNVTPKKSKYFEGPSSDEDEDEDEDKDKDDDDTAAASEDETSGYEDENASASHASSALPSTTSSSSSVEDASDSSNLRRKRTKKKAAPQQAKKRDNNNNAKNAATTAAAGSAPEKGKELWRQGVKTGLGPGKEVFIERPKPRGDGGVKYVPDRIHPNTMAFLADLMANNEREWLKCECGLGPLSFHGFFLEGEVAVLVAGLGRL
jgi:hypothetical protein